MINFAYHPPENKELCDELEELAELGVQKVKNRSISGMTELTPRVTISDTLVYWAVMLDDQPVYTRWRLERRIDSDRDGMLEAMVEIKGLVLDWLAEV